MNEVWLDGPWLSPDGWQSDPLGITGTVLGDPGRAARRIDTRGKRILPGLVDIHGDGFERHLAPRRGAMNDIRQGLLSAEADLASNGITTAILAQFWSWEGGLRSPEFASKVLGGIDAIQDLVATDLRVQLRLETHYLETLDDALAAIERHQIRYVAFNDHLPHDRLATGRKPKRLEGTALKSGRNPQKHLEFMQALHGQSDLVPAAMDDFTAKLNARGVLVASHDDSDAAIRAEWRARGAGISEFPETLDAAQSARDNGEGVIMGAPNVVRGASHKGNISARDLVEAGLVDALASDYHFPSMRQAVLTLEAPLEDVWHMISTGPARLLQLNDRGTLETDKRADLVILDEASKRIELTMAGGEISFARGEMAARLI